MFDVWVRRAVTEWFGYGKTNTSEREERSKRASM